MKKPKIYTQMGALYSDGSTKMLGPLKELKDTGTTLVTFPKYYFFKDGRPKKKYFKRSTYPRL